MATAKRPNTNKPANAADSGWIKRDRRLAIYLRDRFTCLYCLRDLHDADPRDITLDHGKPDNKESNIVTACRSCNCARQDKPLARFAGPETRSHIRRNCKRSLAPYRKLARALIEGTTGMEETMKAL